MIAVMLEVTAAGCTGQKKWPGGNRRSIVGERKLYRSIRSWLSWVRQTVSICKQPGRTIPVPLLSGAGHNGCKIRPDDVHWSYRSSNGVHGESNPAEYPEERYMHPIQLSPTPDHTGGSRRSIYLAYFTADIHELLWCLRQGWFSSSVWVQEDDTGIRWNLLRYWLLRSLIDKVL